MRGRNARSKTVTALALALVCEAGCGRPERAPLVLTQSVSEQNAPRSAQAHGNSTEGSLAAVSSFPADEVVLRGAALPAPPAEPPIEPVQLERIAYFETVVAQTGECWTSSPEMRIMHVPDRKCPAWFEGLAGGGVAAAHAIGRALVAEVPRRPGVEQRLAAVLARTDITVGAAYLLRAMHAQLTQSSGGAQAGRGVRLQSLVSSFEFLTGYPINTLAVWDYSHAGQLETQLRDAMVRALRWGQSPGTPDERATRAVARVRLWLGADYDRALRAADLVLQTESHPLRSDALAVLTRLSRDERAPSGVRSHAVSLLARQHQGSLMLGE